MPSRTPLQTRSPLHQALAQLESFRTSLGDLAVDAAAAALRRHALDGGGATDAQRLRQVSVLFADVADSTAMLARVGADEAMELLGRALQDFADAVRQWDGEVLRFTGDGIKAAFGTRGLREDEAERAVRAGLQMLDSARRHAAQVQRELGIAGFAVRVGIHTGPVLLGGGVEAERSAMGHAVHLAARMEQSAPAGRLRISEGTWGLVRGLFVAAEQPPLLVKGSEAPLRTWLVDAVAAGAEPSVQRGIEGIRAPMVGRDGELAQLLALAEASRRSGSSRVALVQGEAGSGKTRLRQELLQALGLQEGAPGLLQARAAPSSPLQPFGLLRQLLARAFAGLDAGAEGDSDPERTSEHTSESTSESTRLVRGLGPWLAEPADVALIGHLIGLDFSSAPVVQALGPTALRTRAFAALRAALLAQARQAPLLLVFDDLHWADDASLAFVRTLLAPADAPLLLLLLARPALAEREGGFELPPAPQALALALQPLAGGSDGALLDALLQPLPEPPPQLKAMLLARAAGNPLFLEALVRMLADDGVIDTRQRPWRVHAERLQALRVPPTLVGVLQAQLDALPPLQRQTLQAASIVGTPFWPGALLAVAPGPQTLPALQALEQRALVVRRPGGDEYTFAHQLLHDTTYGTLLKPQRRQGHAQVARWLVSGQERGQERGPARGQDSAPGPQALAEYLGVAAEHFERAGDNEQALDYWQRALFDANRRFAHEASLQFLARALDQPALQDAQRRYALMSMRFTKLDFLGRAEAQASREALAAFAEAEDDDAMRADELAHRMLAADHQGDPRLARELALQVLAAADKARAAHPGDDRPAPAAALAHGELAWLAVQAQRHDEVATAVAAGLEQARAAAALPKHLGGYAGYEQQLRVIAIESLLAQQRFVDALAELALAQAALGDTPGFYDRYNLVQRRCIALRLLGRLEEAAELAREQRELAQATSVARLHVPALLAVADVALCGQQPELAEPLLQEAHTLAAATDGGFDLPRVLESQGRLALAQQRIDAACACWDEATALYRQQQREDLATALACERAALDLQRGRAEAALAVVDAALQQPLNRLGPAAVVACAQVLQAHADPRTATLLHALQARLQVQLAAIAPAAERERLLAHVPHWHDAQRLLAAAGMPLAEAVAVGSTAAAA